MKTLLSIATLAAAAVLAATSAPSTSAAPAAAGTEWTAVHSAYTQARDRGETGAIDQALELADAYVKAHPADGRALTYRGSLAAMRARASLLPWRKLSYLHEGIQQMDDGVERVVRDGKLAGGDVEIDVRMVRGITSARIPRAFGRGGTAVADFRAITSLPRFDQLQPEHRASALAWLAVLAQRQGDEKASTDLLNRARASDARTAQTIWESQP